jgi:hypothetical protein
MKLHVLFDKEGEILAAAQIDTSLPVRVRPVPDEKAGHRAAQVYVPAEYRHYDIAGVCQRMKVEVKKGKLAELKAKE